MFAAMERAKHKTLKLAILDLYEGVANEGMRCIREILQQYALTQQIELHWKEFDVRRKLELPGLEFDAYISSGGPGSPLESEGSEWERRYFNWIKSVEAFNAIPGQEHPKKVLFICHSYQLACRYFEVAHVTKRKSTAFGVFPVHMLEKGKQEPVFAGLDDPFYAVDSRDYQVVQPNKARMRALGASILCIEKERPHVPLERAVMAIRFNKHMIGTQFHPEADAIGMSMYLQRADRKKIVIDNHGYEKWASMIERLNDPDKIMWTSAHILPNFLSMTDPVMAISH